MHFFDQFAIHPDYNLLPYKTLYALFLRFFLRFIKVF